MKKIYLFILIIIVVGCKGNPESIPSSADFIPEIEEILEIEEEPEPEEVVEVEDNSNKTENIFTGQLIDKELANKRPVAVVINNLIKALPQSGISQADICYEVLAEADITRIIAIFSNFDSQKVGPIRSARHYFLDFALDNNAVFVHHGGSPQAYNEVKSLRVNNLDGMSLEGITFWRDKERTKTPGMREHSSYTDYEKIMEAIDSKKYDPEINEDYKPMFNFHNELFVLPQNALEANKITVPYSRSQLSVFEYDTEDEVYKKLYKDFPHIDEENNEQLKVSNVIIQYADMYIISGDAEGRREVKLIGEGNGILATGGFYKEITWSKKDHNSPTEWFDDNGEPLTLNQGKTWICVFSKNDEITIE